MTRTLAEQRADVSGLLLAVESARDLEIVERVVRVLLGAGEAERVALGMTRTAALRVAVTPMQELIDRSSLGAPARASCAHPLSPASTLPIADLTAELEAGRRCARCLDPIVAGSCECPELFGDAEDVEAIA